MTTWTVRKMTTTAVALRKTKPYSIEVFLDGETVPTTPKPLSNISDDDIIRCFSLIDKIEKKQKPTRLKGAVAAFDAYCDDNRELYDSLKRQYNTANKPDEIEIIDVDVTDDTPTLTSFSDLESMVKLQCGDDFARIYRIVATIIMSMHYADTESIYFIILAPAGSGKSTVLSLFRLCDATVCIDSATANVLAPGTAREDQETHSLLDDASNKTLIVHDLTSLFSDEQSKIKSVKGVFENIFGKSGYIKPSPGAGLRTYGKRLNLVFGVNPHAFWATYRGSDQYIGLDLITTERYIYHGVSDRDHFADYINGKIVTDKWKTDIAKLTAKYLDNVKPIEISISNEDRSLIAKHIKCYFDDLDETTRPYKNGTQTRRIKQCEMFCKASACLDGRGKIDASDVDLFVSCLKLPDYRPPKIDKASNERKNFSEFGDSMSTIQENDEPYEDDNDDID